MEILLLLLRRHRRSRRHRPFLHLSVFSFSQSVRVYKGIKNKKKSKKKSRAVGVLAACTVSPCQRY